MTLSSMVDAGERLRIVDVTRAAVELAVARLHHRGHQLEALIDRNPAPAEALSRADASLADRIAFVIPRVAARVPWRADCLVQALAAERWLASAGIASRLTLGVPRDKRPDFEAHAWLTAGNRIVTGGDISGYVPLARP